MSFVEKHVKPADAKEAAQAILTLFRDPDIAVLINDVNLAKIRGTLSGVVSGQITMGDKTLDKPLKELQNIIFDPFRCSVFDEASHFLTPRSGVLCADRGQANNEYGHRRDMSQEKVALEDGSIPHYVLSDTGHLKFDRHPLPKNVRLLDDEGINALDAKINALNDALETAYAAGICVENNPLSSKQRGHSAA